MSNVILEYISTDLMKWIALIWFLSVVVNVIVEVIKGVTGVSGSAMLNCITLVVSVVLTFSVMYVAFRMNDYDITFYTLIGLIIMGIIVAYGAMFGYDKLVSTFKDSMKGVE